MKQKFTTYHITILAFAIVVNIVGGQIALMLRLPIYLDSMGTILTSILYGPVYGMLTSLLSGIILGITVDSYALYFAPAGMLFGLLMGILWKKKVDKTWWIFVVALCVSVPTSFVSAGISAYLFGGITYSGSSYLVQLLSKTPLGLTLSCFIVQFFTDYIDRVVEIGLILLVLKKLPKNFIKKKI